MTGTEDVSTGGTESVGWASSHQVWTSVCEKNVSKWEQACCPLGPSPWMCAHVLGQGSPSLLHGVRAPESMRTR